jgi:hypothetical protein
MARTNKPAGETSDAPKTTTRGSKRGNGSASDFNDPDAIAKRAYEIFQQRGGRHGADLDDWLEAERQLKRGATDVNAAAGPVPAKPRRRKIAEGTGP